MIFWIILIETQVNIIYTMKHHEIPTKLGCVALTVCRALPASFENQGSHSEALLRRAAIGWWAHNKPPKFTRNSWLSVLGSQSHLRHLPKWIKMVVDSNWRDQHVRVIVYYWCPIYIYMDQLNVTCAPSMESVLELQWVKFIWRFPKMGVPPNHPNLVLKPVVTKGSTISRNLHITNFNPLTINCGSPTVALGRSSLLIWPSWCVRGW